MKENLSIEAFALSQVAGMEKTEADPIGDVKPVKEVDTYVATLIEEWTNIRGERTWWKIWQRTTAGLYKATKFLLNSIDGLIWLVDDLVDLGPDKKATVMNAVDILYDYIVREAIPIWMRPFAGRVKSYIMSVLVSTAIDWMVAKYREGAWKEKTA